MSCAEYAVMEGVSRGDRRLPPHGVRLGGELGEERCRTPFCRRYASQASLDRAIAGRDARVVRQVPALRTAEVLTTDPAGLGREPGIRSVTRARARTVAAEPALAQGTDAPGLPFEWQYAATHADQVPLWVQQAASAVTIAVVDTGADLTAPDLAAKTPLTYNAVTRKSGGRDDVGHGTFVASLAAGSISNGEGIAGFGGDARLMVVKANRGARQFDDVDEAAAIVWATNHGAKIINLSLGGGNTSAVERKAVDYAVSRGVLLVASAGNSHAEGDPVQYPAALLQPPDSNGAPGRGLSVAASDSAGVRASFSSANSTVSLAAPGANVLGAVARDNILSFQRVTLPGSSTGAYGYGSGTSYASPQVAGAAALVWGANPNLTAAQVADILRRSASGNGSWNAELGFGVLDVARAVALAGTTPAPHRAFASTAAGTATARSSPGGAPARPRTGSPSAPTAPTPASCRRPAPPRRTRSRQAIPTPSPPRRLDAEGTTVSSSSPYRIVAEQSHVLAKTKHKHRHH